MYQIKHHPAIYDHLKKVNHSKSINPHNNLLFSRRALINIDPNTIVYSEYIDIYIYMSIKM